MIEKKKKKKKNKDLNEEGGFTKTGNTSRPLHPFLYPEVNSSERTCCGHDLLAAGDIMYGKQAALKSGAEKQQEEEAFGLNQVLHLRLTALSSLWFFFTTL